MSVGAAGVQLREPLNCSILDWIQDPRATKLGPQAKLKSIHKCHATTLERFGIVFGTMASTAARGEEEQGHYSYYFKSGGNMGPTAYLEGGSDECLATALCIFAICKKYAEVKMRHPNVKMEEYLRAHPLEEQERMCRALLEEASKCADICGDHLLAYKTVLEGIVHNGEGRSGGGGGEDSSGFQAAIHFIQGMIAFMMDPSPQQTIPTHTSMCLQAAREKEPECYLWWHLSFLLTRAYKRKRDHSELLRYSRKAHDLAPRQLKIRTGLCLIWALIGDEQGKGLKQWSKKTWSLIRSVEKDLEKNVDPSPLHRKWAARKLSELRAEDLEKMKVKGALPSTSKSVPGGPEKKTTLSAHKQQSRKAPTLEPRSGSGHSKSKRSPSSSEQLAACLKALELSPGSYEAMVDLATVKLQRLVGSLKDERDDWLSRELEVAAIEKLLREALKLAPSNSRCEMMALLKTGELYTKRGLPQRIPDSKQIFQDCYKKWPSNSMVLHKVAKFYHYNCNDYPQALKIYEEAMQAAPANYPCLMDYLKLYGSCLKKYGEMVRIIDRSLPLINKEPPEHIVHLMAIKGLALWLMDQERTKKEACDVWLEVFKNFPSLAFRVKKALTSPRPSPEFGKVKISPGELHPLFMQACEKQGISIPKNKPVRQFLTTLIKLEQGTIASKVTWCNSNDLPWEIPSRESSLEREVGETKEKKGRKTQSRLREQFDDESMNVNLRTRHRHK